MKKLLPLLITLFVSYVSFAQEHEPSNNTFTGADTIQLNVVDTGQILTIGDADYFVLHLNQCGALVLNLTQIPGRNCQISVYSSPSSDSLIGSSDINGDQYLEVFPPAGNVYIRITDYYNHTSASYYRLTASMDPYGTSECNNTFGTAYDLSDSTSVQGDIMGVNLLQGLGNDVDYYKIHMKKCASLILNLKQVGGRNYFITAYSSPNPDSIIGSSDINGDQTLELTPASGDVYLKIRDYYNRTSTAPYTLTVSTDAEDQHECNNDFTTASLVPDHASITGKIRGTNALHSPVQDIDIYKVHMSRCGTLSLHLTQVSGRNIQILAYSGPSEDSLIASSDINGDQQLDVTGSTGDVYIKLRDYYNRTSNGIYTLDINLDTTDFYECNNTITTASPISDSTVVAARILGSNGPVNDVDYYKIHMSHCGTLNLFLKQVGGRNYEILAYSAPNTDSLIGRSDINGDQLLQLSGATGDIYIRIDDYYNHVSASLYYLTVWIDSLDFYECNNTFATATPVGDSLTITARIQGSSNGVKDVDFYKVHLSHCGTLTFHLVQVGGRNYFLTAYSAPNTDSVLAITDINGDQYMQISPPSGDVYIKVADYYNRTSDVPYKLVIGIDSTDYYECNNDFAHASPVPDNISIAAKIWGSNKLHSPVNDVDYYKVAIHRCGILTVNLTQVSGRNYFVTAYYITNSDSVVAQSDINGDQAIQLPVSPGFVYLKIADYYNRTSDVPYILNLGLDTTDACECNNTFNTACEIPANTSFDAKIWGSNNLVSPSGDVDYYKIHVDRCGTLVFNLKQVSGRNYFMTAYSAPTPAAQVKISDINGDQSFEIAAAPGDWYLKITDYYNRVSNTPYTLMVAFDTSDRYECNNTFTDAYPIQDTSTIVAEIRGYNDQRSPTGDLDYYKFSTPWCGKLIANLTQVSGRNYYIALYNAKDTAHVAATTNINGDQTLNIDLAPGNYFMRVSDYYNRSSPLPYTVKMNFTPNPAVPVVTQSGPEAFCTGDSVTLTTSSPIPHFWSTGDTSKSIKVRVSGTYTDTIRLVNGCTTWSNSINVQSDPKPSMPVITPAGPINICDGQSAQLTSSSSQNNYWSTKENTTSIKTSSGGTFIDTVKSNVNCFTFSDPVMVFVNANPDVPVLSKTGSIVICPNTTDTIYSSATTENHWSTGGTDSFIVISDAGTYSDTVINSFGCYSVSMPVTASEGENPKAGFTENHNSRDYTFTNTSTNATSYKWYFGDGDSSTDVNPTHTYKGSGSVTVTLYVTNNCGVDSSHKVLSVPTGMEPITGGQLRVTPNPCTICEIHCSVETTELIVSDIMGRIYQPHYTKTTTGYLMQLPGSSAGVYFIQDLKTREVVKFIKQ